MTKNKYSELCKDAFSYENLEKSFQKTLKGKKKYKRDSFNFRTYLEYNLVRLWRDIKNGKYKVSSYNQFYVFEPKKRKINAPKYRDKIVQFAVHEVLKEICEDKFIKDSYACRDDKGSHRAADKVQQYMKTCKWKYGEGWIVKLDVEKFFYSISRDLLIDQVCDIIPPGTFRETLVKIIRSSPEGNTGIPLGCVTSQDLSGLYMTKLDNYCKRFLGIKWYVRYADDVICVVRTREEARELRDKMKWYLKEHLELSTNEQTKIFPIEQGVNAYGYKIWTTHKMVRNQSKRAMKRRIKAMDRKLKEGKLSEKEVTQAVNSWLGHARHSNSFNLCKKIFKKYPYIKVEGDDNFGNRRFNKTGNPVPRGDKTSKTDKALATR